MKKIKNLLNKEMKLINGYKTKTVKHYSFLATLLTFNLLVLSFYVFLLVSLCKVL